MVNFIKNIKKEDELIKELKKENEELKVHDKMQKEFINVALKYDVDVLCDSSEDYKKHPKQCDKLYNLVEKYEDEHKEITSNEDWRNKPQEEEPQFEHNIPSTIIIKREMDEDFKEEESAEILEGEEKPKE